MVLKFRNSYGILASEASYVWSATYEKKHFFLNALKKVGNEVFPASFVHSGIFFFKNGIPFFYLLFRCVLAFHLELLLPPVHFFQSQLSVPSSDGPSYSITNEITSKNAVKKKDTYFFFSRKKEFLF